LHALRRCCWLFVLLLLLQVFDKWSDDSDSLAAAGALPLQQVRLVGGDVPRPGAVQQEHATVGATATAAWAGCATSCHALTLLLGLMQVLDLCQEEPTVANSSSGEEEVGASHAHSSTFLVQLSLDPSSPEAAAVQQQQQQSVLLQVAVSYSTSTCFDLQEPSAAALADAAVADAGQQQEALPLLKQEGSQQDDQGQDDTSVQQQQQQEEVVGDESRAVQHATGSPQSPAAAAGVGSDSQQYPLVLHDQQPEQQPTAAGVGQLRQSPQVSPSSVVGVHAGEGQAPAAAAAVEAAADAAVPLTAELCVKVVRACGLQVGTSKECVG
jgi:hypothetical protein